MAIALPANALSFNVLAADTKPLVYTWKPGEIYRFEYSKTLTVTPADPGDTTEPEKTDITGVLILEVAADGNSSMLRFDAARLTLPPAIIFTSGSTEPAPDPVKDKNKVVAKSMESALKGARWDVLPGTDGTLHIKDRKPAVFDEWTKDIRAAAAWRSKSLRSMDHLIENDVGLKAQCDDQELLLCFGAPPAGEKPPAMAHLHPVRSELTQVSRDGVKARFSFKRARPDQADKPYAIHDLAAPGEISTKLESVTTTDGSATFDEKLGMLDTLAEDFTADISLKYKGTVMNRQVRVQYKIRRLAPPIPK